MNAYLLAFVGVIIAACVFAATLWSAAQAYRVKGPLRIAHLICIVLTIAAMTCLQFQWQQAAQITGTLLILAALRTLWLESGWNRILPLFQGLFGAMLAINLPFA